ncbi:MAG: hypothetical protein JRJ54_09065 [Deltaproteobacteria bacterium]|nr:hypothetical protein [Deltaproteobacteria bacterium]
MDLPALFFLFENERRVRLGCAVQQEHRFRGDRKIRNSNIPKGFTFMKENRASEKIMREISMLIGRLGHPPAKEAFEAHREAPGNLIQRLPEIDPHYISRENSCFLC